MRQLTPKRLKENEDFVWRLADRQIDELMGGGQAELMTGYANPFAMFVIADLLGVPESDTRSSAPPCPGRTGAGGWQHEVRNATQPAGVALRPVQPLHRRPPPRAARRRPHGLATPGSRTASSRR